METQFPSVDLDIDLLVLSRRIHHVCQDLPRGLSEWGSQQGIFTSKSNQRAVWNVVLPQGTHAPSHLVGLPVSFFSSVTDMCSCFSWIKVATNLVFTEEHNKGGHFAAYEVPELLAGDLRKMLGRGGPAFGVVGGKNGYDG